MKKVVILIDGANLFYGLKNLGILERDIKWDVFFKAIVASDEELLRTYWFRPEKILDSYYTHENIVNQIVYKKYNSVYAAFKSNPSTVAQPILDSIFTDVQAVEDWLQQEKAKFSSIEYNYDKISLEFGDIEFVKTGIVKVNPFSQQYIGEKGVDISLAVKMIALSVEKRCDKIILISGDYDYAEAIKFVKNNMTKIHLVKFHKGYPPKNKSVSRDLAVLADKVIDVYESELRTTYSKHSLLP